MRPSPLKSEALDPVKLGVGIHRPQFESRGIAVFPLARYIQFVILCRQRRHGLAERGRSVCHNDWVRWWRLGREELGYKMALFSQCSLILEPYRLSN